MTSKHTPGPWWVYKRGSGIEVHAAHRGPGSDFCIAPINSWADDRLADARLISAAPELYEALQAIIARWDTPAWKDTEPTADVINRARAALSKAQ